MLIQILDECRTERNLPVRTAAQDTIKILKDLLKDSNQIIPKLRI
jgi:hypothetical protein